MGGIKMPHTDHENHLCYLHNVGYVSSNLEGYKKLVAGGQYMCKACGRVAASEKNLCVPVKL